MSPKNLSLEETETVIQQDASRRNEWNISTEDVVWQRRLESLGIEPHYTSADGEYKEYKIDGNQLTIRRKPKPMSEEQKAALAERLSKSRKSS